MRRWLKLKRHRVRKPRVVIAEAERANLRLPDALAMLEQETGIPQRNIFGCDYGPGKAFCHERVTKGKVATLLAGPLSNGIGWTQITYKPLIPAALRSKMHRPRYQMRVGFGVLANNIRQYGQREGHARYNGSGPAAEAYGDHAVDLAHKWHRILTS
jgi:hypothetical protein